ncbi:LysM peptidoglycan-binding domain-containing protein [Candidatus Aerophobetes bacterium]|nr:LysM peptidoglycan-binding domain-containing protein [Candidatus Aerophobetes bacterium]
MLKKVVKNFLIFLAGFTVIASFAWAQESSPSTEVEELIVQIQALRAEISQLKEMVDQAREIAVDSRLEAEKFKEETLYRLGLWRTRLGEGMMMSLSAKKASERAEEAARSASEQIELVLKRMKGVEERFGILSKKVEEEISARIKLEEKSTELERKLALLSQDVESLKTDVALAKEMAATAKAQADQAQLDVQRLSGEVRKNRELFLSSIEKILEQIKEKEKKFKAEKVELKAPPSAMIYRVKKGDSLWSIAGSPEVYNDPNKWKKIFEANKDRLTSPDLLYPGQKLIIPRE